MKIFENSQAVSESLGYIMIFGVVVGCIAIMFVTGNQIIASNQASTSFQSMQQNFNVIQSNLMTTASGSSPVKTTTFNINYGTLSLLPEDESNSMIVINFDGNPPTIPHMKLGTLLFSATPSGAIALEDGAIIASYSYDNARDSIMTQEPRLFYSSTSGTLMICTFNIVGDKSSLSSSYTSLKLKSGELPTPDTYKANDQNDGESLEFNVSTNFANAWKLYLADIPGLSCSVPDPGSPPGWVNVTMSDKNSASHKGIKKLIVVNYEVQATLG